MMRGGDGHTRREAPVPQRYMSKDDLKLHMFEEVEIIAADGEKLRSVLQFYRSPSGKRMAYPVYPGDIDDGAAVYLPELRWVELIGQFFDALFDERFTFFCHDQRVFVIGLEVIYFFNGDEPDGVFVLGFDPAQAISLCLRGKPQKNLLDDFG